jgi:ubiquinone/menaquinone biosynthesis C-methylase UbiE
LRIAPLVHEVIAVDVSKTMIELLTQNALRASIDNVVGRAVPIEHLEIPEGSVDLVVSNYALHHLRDEDKALAVKRATRWLRAGGRLDHHLKAHRHVEKRPRWMVAHCEERGTLSLPIPRAPDFDESMDGAVRRGWSY